jgi:hypothetical protein
MTSSIATLSKAALPSLLAWAMMPVAARAVDLSKYRDFELGTDLPAIAKQVGASESEVKTIHRRPALIQELQWRPQPLGPSSKPEAAQDVLFSFYNGELFQISINYDLHETEGLTSGDIVEAISATYGSAGTPTAPGDAVLAGYGDPEEVVTRWQDSQYSFDLIRLSYGPTFKLVGTLKRLQVPVQSAIAESKRLDDREAPQREATRIADEKETEMARLEKSRLVNKLKFRP